MFDEDEGNPTAHVSRCVYCVNIAATEASNYATFVITPKAYWEEYEKCADCFDDLEDAPLGFHNSSESQWGYTGPINEGAEKLQTAGCEFSEAMDKWINS